MFFFIFLGNVYLFKLIIIFENIEKKLKIGNLKSVDQKRIMFNVKIGVIFGDFLRDIIQVICSLRPVKSLKS